MIGSENLFTELEVRTAQALSRVTYNILLISPLVVSKPKPRINNPKLVNCKLEHHHEY